MRHRFLLLLGSAVVVALWFVLQRPAIEPPPLAVTGTEVYIDGQPDGADAVPVGHIPVVCLVVVVGETRVLRTADRVPCATWLRVRVPPPAEVQAIADRHCATVDVWIPRGERVRAANPCDTLVYHHPPEGQTA